MKNFGLYLLLFKLGSKFGPLLLKVLKSAKVAKGGLAVASLGAYSYMFTWEFAVILLFAIVVHEYGHLKAMQNLGIKTKGIWLIPFFGGAAVSSEGFKNFSNESYVAIMGPVYGVATLVPFYALWVLTNNPMWIGIVSFIALINVFNLLPINPLDGGRIVKSIAFSMHSYLGITIIALGMVAAFLMAFFYNIYILYFIFIIGLIELVASFREFRFNSEDNKQQYMDNSGMLKMGVSYLLLFSLFVGIIYYCSTVEGADLALKLLKDDV